MRRTHTIAAVLAAGTLTVAAARPALFQQEEMQMPQPTPEHAELQKHVGEYEGTLTYFQPGMEEMSTTAQETVTSAGPFWTVSNFTCDFMGMPYEGHGCSGYDPVKKKYIGTWIDNMSSYLAVMEGEHDAAKSTTFMRWNAPDMTGKIVPHRSEIVHGKDAYTMTFYTDGVKSMVIAMKRKSAM